MHAPPAARLTLPPLLHTTTRTHTPPPQHHPLPRPPAGLPYYSTPCSLESPAGELPRCAALEATGGRAASTCGDEQCYLEVLLDGEAVYVPDFPCGASEASSPLGEPGDPLCPGMGTAGMCGGLESGVGWGVRLAWCVCRHVGICPRRAGGRAGG